MVEKTPAPSSTPLFPEKVGKYELLLPIGTGGMATVYLARAVGVGGFERDVALKLVHAHLRTDEESKLQLLEEAKLAARIRHPNVVPVLEVDEDPLGLFLVMDYVEGDTLSGLVRACRAMGRTLPRQIIARILHDALLGLHTAHELTDETGKPLRLVHRDFSPQNILVSVQGVTRLADFGVAKAADRAVRTKTGLVKGKISYMSPEQARGHAVDRRCDVWAAGVVAWELIAGRRIHRSDDDVATLLSIVTEDRPRLRSVVPDVPKALDDAVAWALSPDVNKRCPTAEELRRTLAAAFQEGTGMADVQDLARFVQQVVGPKLNERRDSVAEVRTLRQRMGQLTRQRTEDQDQSDDNAATSSGLKSSKSAERPWPGARQEPTTITPRTTARMVPKAALAPTDPARRGEAANGNDTAIADTAPAATKLFEGRVEELTETSAVVSFLAATRRDPKRWLIAGAGGLLALGILLALTLGGQSAEPDATQAASASAAEAAAARELGDSSKPPHTESAPSELQQAAAAPQADAELKAAKLAEEEAQKSNAPEEVPTTAPAAPKGPQVRRSAPEPISEAPPSRSTSKKPKLADSPYTTPKSAD